MTKKMIMIFDLYTAYANKMNIISKVLPLTFSKFQESLDPLVKLATPGRWEPLDLPGFLGIVEASGRWAVLERREARGHKVHLEQLG